MGALFTIALRYLWGHRRRYLFVLAVLSLGFAFITASSTLADGMEASVTSAALRHYAGHIFVVGRDRAAGGMMVIDDDRLIMSAVEALEMPVERVITRAHEHNGASLFHQGNTVRIKDLFGVDFAAEADLFQSFDYVDSVFDPAWPADTVVISEPAARELRARPGDEVILRLTNRNRQVDTRPLIVRAVTADSSIYGYARAYMDRETQSALMDLAPGAYSVAGIFLPDLQRAPAGAQDLHAALADLVPTAGRIETKEDLTSEIRSRWEGTRYFTFALPVYISEVTDLLLAMQAGAYALLSMIILVVLASVLVTYRVVLHERTREIGTMLAVGFPRYWVVMMLLVETVLLLIVGITAGFLISGAITQLVSRLSFAWIPGFEIFTRQGRLMAHYTLRRMTVNVAIVLGTVLPVMTAMVAHRVHQEIPALIKGEIT